MFIIIIYYITIGKSILNTKFRQTLCLKLEGLCIGGNNNLPHLKFGNSTGIFENARGQFVI